MDITGDLSGIKTSQLLEFKELLIMNTERTELVNPNLVIGLAHFSQAWNREIAVYINRSGIVCAAGVGKHASVTLPKLKGRINTKKLRCIHTHPNGSAKLSSVDLSALLSLDLEFMVAVGIINGDIMGAEIAYITDNGLTTLRLEPEELAKFDLRYVVSSTSSRFKKNENDGIEKGILLGLSDDRELGLELLNELKELARTAGAEVVGQILQPRRFSNARSYIGKGRLEEVQFRIQETGANVLICDDELTPSQVRSLQEATQLKILDRTTLILDIFAQRALSREGKLQVELAQLQHLLPHLSGLGQDLSRLGGGVGTRGPGETKLETDRRRVRQRITQLERELADVKKNRQIRRQQRHESGLPLVALVGYTNAGKTTFMQHSMSQLKLSSSAPIGEDKLFATLDPIIRRIPIDTELEILLSDTVGFIRKLPHSLLKAFLATLEEVQQATVLLHILDASHPRALEQAEIVNEVLKELGVADKPTVTILNKVDKISYNADIDRLAHELPNPIPLSLKNDDSLNPVWQQIKTFLRLGKHQV